MDSAVVLDRFGDVGDLTLQPIELRPLLPTEVRISVAVAGLNPVDWQIVESRTLATAFGLEVPMGFGNDFAGIIVGVGTSVRRWSIGDRVFGGARGRAVATSITLDENHPGLHRTPPGISDLEAGALDIAGRTASAVVDALSARPDETVLVGAAGGGVGSILTQLLGARPVEYGAGLAAEVAATGLRVAAAADLHGTETAETAIRLGVSPHRVVTIEADDPPAGVVQVNGSDARSDALDRLLVLISEKDLRIPVAAVYGLGRFREAVAHQRRRHVHGKIVITPSM